MPPKRTKLPLLSSLKGETIRHSSPVAQQPVLPRGRGRRSLPERRTSPGRAKGAPQGLLAQVDGEEVLGHQALAHHVVKDRDGPRRGDAGEGQPQDAVEGVVGQKGARLLLAEANGLVVDLDVSNLGREKKGRRCAPFWNKNTRFAPRESGERSGALPTCSILAWEP